MSHSSWEQRPPPVPWPAAVAVWNGQPRTAAELTGMRRRLRAALADGGLPVGSDDVERLLLAVEELVSNGLRHGRPPVQVTITAIGLGWLVEVEDTATALPPAPAIGRDAALGGMGLHMVARLSRAHGWTVRGGRKVVWANVPYRTPIDRPSAQRIRAATARARDLVACLAETEARIAATVQRLAADAAVDSGPERARAYLVVAERAHREAEQARRRSRSPLLASGGNSGRPGSSPGPVLGSVDRARNGEPRV